jgi:hypothetical protein
MKLSESPSIDIRQRFREELKIQDLPSPLQLSGNAMQREIAKLLLKEQGIVTHHQGIPVQLMSMEAYCGLFLASFLEERDPPQGKFLLTTIPEAELIAFATAHNIPVEQEQIDDVRTMLDNIAKAQPQTYFSLRRSSDRLRAAAEMLRTSQQK